MIARFALVALACCASSAVAQSGNWMVDLPASPPAKPAAAATGSGPSLKAGTEVKLALAPAAKGKKLGVGQRVPLTVASDVKLGWTTVIPAGTEAEGEVTAVNGGDLTAKPLYVRVKGKAVKLAGTFGSSGKATLGEDLKVNN
ncbi:hypothetical protein G7077_04260 [Sphingomonas piscis]|uniref:Flagellar protein n=1 Tax=Sphingomonas piscis TaxID=2714943 RepID=A0A6G7YNC1_9SPHN|nr:hypothetical protein [Sphingomonas piscis]QIK78234.1 hypothetical protein G7077_04260 [Sphingomonas piscis]